MAFSKTQKKGEMTIETVIIIVLFLAILAIIILVVSSLTGKGSDSMGTTIESTGSGALCEIECMKCCSGQVNINCNQYIIDSNYGSCCVDTKTGEEEYGC
ncbi:MAG: hypothetical protein K0B07_02350 [DPANN group archaeon]|nr:hypothetical protein [DPANN group archaeon]